MDARLSFVLDAPHLTLAAVAMSPHIRFADRNLPFGIVALQMYVAALKEIQERCADDPMLCKSHRRRYGPILIGLALIGLGVGVMQDTHSVAKSEEVQHSHSVAKSEEVQDTHSLAKSVCRSVVVGAPSPAGSC